ESFLLASIGGTMGGLFAFAAVKIVLSTLPGTLPRAEEIALDGRVLVFTGIVTISAAIFFGLAPALRGARTDLQTILKEGGRGSSGARHRMQSMLVAVEW